MAHAAIAGGFGRGATYLWHSQSVDVVLEDDFPLKSEEIILRWNGRGFGALGGVDGFFEASALRWTAYTSGIGVHETKVDEWPGKVIFERVVQMLDPSELIDDALLLNAVDDAIIEWCRQSVNRWLLAVHHSTATTLKNFCLRLREKFVDGRHLPENFHLLLSALEKGDFSLGCPVAILLYAVGLLPQVHQQQVLETFEARAGYFRLGRLWLPVPAGSAVKFSLHPVSVLKDIGGVVADLAVGAHAMGLAVARPQRPVEVGGLVSPASWWLPATTRFPHSGVVRVRRQDGKAVTAHVTINADWTVKLFGEDELGQPVSVSGSDHLINACAYAALYNKQLLSVNTAREQVSAVLKGSLKCIHKVDRTLELFPNKQLAELVISLFIVCGHRSECLCKSTQVGDELGKLAAGVSPADLMPNARWAVSHAWQTRVMFDEKVRVAVSQATGGQCWIDLEHQDHEKEPLSKLATRYRNKSVVIVDPAVNAIKDVAIALMVSDWADRGWTLQESALAKRLYVYAHNRLDEVVLDSPEDHQVAVHLGRHDGTQVESMFMRALSRVWRREDIIKCFSHALDKGVETHEEAFRLREEWYMRVLLSCSNPSATTGCWKPVVPGQLVELSDDIDTVIGDIEEDGWHVRGELSSEGGRQYLLLRSYRIPVEVVSGNKLHKLGQAEPMDNGEVHADLYVLDGKADGRFRSQMTQPGPAKLGPWYVADIVRDVPAVFSGVGAVGVGDVTPTGNWAAFGTAKSAAGYGYLALAVYSIKVGVVTVCPELGLDSVGTVMAIMRYFRTGDDAEQDVVVEACGDNVRITGDFEGGVDMVPETIGESVILKAPCCEPARIVAGRRFGASGLRGCEECSEGNWATFTLVSLVELYGLELTVDGYDEDAHVQVEPVAFSKLPRLVW